MSVDQAALGPAELLGCGEAHGELHRGGFSFDEADPGGVHGHGEGLRNVSPRTRRGLAVFEQGVHRLGPDLQASIALGLDPPPRCPVVDVCSHLGRQQPGRLPVGVVAAELNPPAADRRRRLVVRGQPEPLVQREEPGAVLTSGPAPAERQVAEAGEHRSGTPSGLARSSSSSLLQALEDLSQGSVPAHAGRVHARLLDLVERGS